MRARSRLAAALVVSAVLAAPASASVAKLPTLPHGWPRSLQIGLTDSPGVAAALRRSAPFGFRYQYLAGGVNTGQGWSTWNPNGTFASMYVQDSWRHGVVPVLTYYMLLQSKPSLGDEAQTDLAHLRDPQLMQQYWSDVHLLLQRVRGAKTVVVHVEPDLWGYLEQAGGVALASSFAQEWIKLRDELAPNVLLAYHMSGWGTKHDIVYEDPPDATVRAYATQSAAFYRSLHARFDVAFEDFSDRDAGFYEKVQGNPRTWFTPADFHRHLLYGATFVKLAGVRLAAWQIPLGNTVMRAMDNTWGHYQDNRVQWLLGTGCSQRVLSHAHGRAGEAGTAFLKRRPLGRRTRACTGAAGRVHLRAYVAAGYVGFLFGGGADGTTCACDARKDGVTNPPPIGGNTRTSLSADDDGGYFRAQVRAYYRGGPLKLPG